MQGRCFALQSTKAWTNAQSCSAKHFQSSHLLQNMKRFQIRSISADVCCWSNFCINMHGLWRGFQEHKERGSKGGEELWGGERMVWDVEGRVLTVRRCSSGLVYSSYRLTGRRWDVGVTVMETRMHTWTMRHGDISMRNNENMKKTSCQSSRCILKLLETLTCAVLRQVRL